MSVNYGGFAPLLVEGLRELKLELEGLKDLTLQLTMKLREAHAEINGLRDQAQQQQQRQRQVDERTTHMDSRLLDLERQQQRWRRPPQRR